MAEAGRWKPHTHRQGQLLPAFVEDALDPGDPVFFISDAVDQMEKTLTLFNIGHLSIELRALTERLFWAFGRKLQRIVRDLDYVPEELAGLDSMLSDTYFCNFSVFQSMPD